MNYPSIGEYNQTIQKNGGNAFRTLSDINLIPSRTTPIKVYLFGSGAFAAVFKGSINGNTYAIRCFLSVESDTIERYKNICKYISQLNSPWKTDCEFINSEIVVKGIAYPVLKMEWIEGVLINKFISRNLSNNNLLSKLQNKLISISEDLEKNKVGHGDLQCGNIVISGHPSNFEVKLIDYDGMYVPELAFNKAIEKGRSEFQHPKRTLNDFNPEMDRFSFWVMLTALEAIKIDKSLWNKVMLGGFNTLDNFLFTIQDFLNPSQSPLFNRLYKLNSSNLNFYLDKLKWYCCNDYTAVTKPVLVNNKTNQAIEKIGTHQRSIQYNTNHQLIDNTVSNNKYKIISNNCSASILTSTFKKIGSTPLELDKNIYEGKVIIVSNGRETKRIKLCANQHLIEIDFN